MTEQIDDLFSLVGASLDGKYDVASVVAEGGYGIVYRAVHVGLQKPVALKVLKVPVDLPIAARTAFLEKFTQEARLIGALDHPAIVRVLDFGVSPMPQGEPSPWMALEWLDGVTLEAHLEALGGRGMAPAEVYALLGPVLSAIALAHDEGVSHRDIKPANVMLAQSRRGERTLKVLDFGIAKFSAEADGAGSGSTRTGSLLVAFSPHYAAPEQITGMRTGPWTDVHALALMAVEMLTGRAPLEGADASELYAAVLAPTRPTPAARGLDVGAWEPVLGRALAFKPSERFPNAGALSEALREALPGARWQPLALRASQAPPDAPAVHTPTAVGTPLPETFRGAEVPGPPPVPSRGWSVALIAASVIVIGAVLAALSHGDAPRAPMPEAHVVGPAPTPVTLAPTVASAADVPEVVDVSVAAASAPTTAAPMLRARVAPREPVVRARRVVPATASTSPPPTRAARPIVSLPIE